MTVQIFAIKVVLKLEVDVFKECAYFFGFEALKIFILQIKLF